MAITQQTPPVRTRRPFPTYIIVFLLPAFVIYSLFMIYPLFDSLRLSLYNQADAANPVFVGLENFNTLLNNPAWAERFWGALGNNFIFFSVHMFIQNPLALLLATLLTVKKLRGRAIYRTLIFAPTTLSVVIIGFVWSLILSPLWAAKVLKSIGLGALVQPWLGSEQTALITVSLMSVWQWVGLPMVLFMSALIGIPEELLEASHVDGASPWNVFWRIKIPLLMPTIGIVTILTFVGNFNAFDLIYATQGLLATPNYHTDILGTFFFRTFYGFQLQPGNPTMGTTIAAMMFLIILVGVLTYTFFWQRRFSGIEN